jgi:DNA-binding Lrp family transcriptional regulator
LTRSSLNPTDLKLLIALQEQPIAPYSSLAQKVGLSPQTISHRFQRLRERGHGHVKATLEADALNLEYVNVLLEVNGLDKISTIEKLISEYPYSLYRGRCFGGYNGVFAQFRIPKGFRDSLSIIFGRLKEEGILRKTYEIPVVGRTVYTRPQLAFWNPEDYEWEFSWLEWLNEGSAEGNSSFGKNNPKEEPKKEIILDDLDYVDMHLLFHLTKDARQKQRQITKEVNNATNSQIPPQRISERLRFLMEHAVRDYRVFMKEDVLDIYNEVLFICEAIPSTVDHFKKQLVKNPPPFATAFFKTTDGFMWDVRCPSSQLSTLTEVLTEKTSNFSLNVLDYRHVARYQFWPEVYDPETKNWKTSETFMIDEPLASSGISR